MGCSLLGELQAEQVDCESTEVIYITLGCLSP